MGTQAEDGNVFKPVGCDIDFPGQLKLVELVDHICEHRCRVLDPIGGRYVETLAGLRPGTGGVVSRVKETKECDATASTAVFHSNCHNTCHVGSLGA